MICLPRRRIPLVALAAIAALVAGCGGGDDGSQTSREAVTSALAKTGYEIKYQKVADVAGYEALVGQARNRLGGAVAFAVVLDESGPYPGNDESPDKGTTQPPIVRYSEGTGLVAGNAIYWLQPQSRYVLGNVRNVGRDWKPTHGENEMTRRLGSAVQQLFAPEYRARP